MYNMKHREKLIPPDNEKQVLLHSCCAPCVGELMEAFVSSNIYFEVFFYNPNIHPKKEYDIRKQENMRYCKDMNIPFIDADYDPKRWFQLAEGLEYEPERGKRCTMCFDMRFLSAANYAKEKGYKVFTSSLGISRWKDMDQINSSGTNAAESVGDMTYWTYNWRKKGGSDRMYQIAKENQFYKQ